MTLRYLIYLLLTTIIASSCSDYENNIYINEDGSGKVTMRYDASEMLSMMEMMKGIEEGTEQENKEQDMNEEMDIEADGLGAIMDGLGNPSNMKDIDSTFTFYDVMPDSLMQAVEDPELLKKVSMTINTNKTNMTAIMGMDMQYDNLDQLQDIFETMKVLGDNTDSEESKLGNFKELIRNYDADLKKGIVILPEQDFSGDLGGDMGNEDIDFSNMSEEEAGMMQMMFGNSGFVTTLHLPGEVISCDDAEATIEGNTVTIRDDYMTLMKDQKMKARTVKYKVK